MEERATKRVRLSDSKRNLWHTELCEDVRQETRARLDLASRMALRLTCHAEARWPVLRAYGGHVSWAQLMLGAAIDEGHGALVDWLMDEARERADLHTSDNIVALRALAKRANEDAAWRARLVHMYEIGDSSELFLWKCRVAAGGTDAVHVYQWVHRMLAPIEEADHTRFRTSFVSDLDLWEGLGEAGSIQIALWLWQTYANTYVDLAHWAEFARAAARHGHQDAIDHMLTAVPTFMASLPDDDGDWELVHHALEAGHVSTAWWLLQRFALMPAVGYDEPPALVSVLCAVLEAPTDDDTLVLETAERLWPYYDDESLATLAGELQLDYYDDDDDGPSTIDNYGRHVLYNLGEHRLQWLCARGLWSGPLPLRSMWHDDMSYFTCARTEAALHWLRARGWIDSEWLRMMRDAVDDDAEATAVLACVFTSPAEQAVLDESQ